MRNEKELESASKESVGTNIREASPIETSQVCEYIQEKKDAARLAGRID